MSRARWSTRSASPSADRPRHDSHASPSSSAVAASMIGHGIVRRASRPADRRAGVGARGCDPCRAYRHGGRRWPGGVRPPDPDSRRVSSAWRCRASTPRGARPLRVARSGRIRVLPWSIHRHGGAAAHRTDSMALAGDEFIRGRTSVDNSVKSSERRGRTALASYGKQFPDGFQNPCTLPHDGMGQGRSTNTDCDARPRGCGSYR